MPGIKNRFVSINCMMSDKLWKGIFLCWILLIGDPYVNLKAQTAPPVKVAHNTSQTGFCVL